VTRVVVFAVVLASTGMASDDPPLRTMTVTDAQESAIAQLSDAFAHDRIGVEEFEERLTRVHRATSIADVKRTVSDLVDARDAGVERAELALRPAPVAVVLHPDAALTADSVAAIFGGVERRGPWRVPRRLNVVATMGGIVLDFRDAVLGPGVTEIHVRAVFGGAEILVTPSLAVEVSGTAIFGGFGHVDRMPAGADPGRPMLRVRGVAVFGGVSVETRLPGESEADAHRHRHHALGHPRGAPRLPEKSGR
jgi:Cell wall-active antibiotics response 4TMS YvqF/Domain of unknown function (DUF1707)